MNLCNDDSSREGIRKKDNAKNLTKVLIIFL